MICEGLALLLIYRGEKLLHPLRDVVLVYLAAPLHVLGQLGPQLVVGSLPLQDQVVKVLISQLLPGPTLPGALSALLQLVSCLHLGVKFLLLLAGISQLDILREIKSGKFTVMTDAITFKSNWSCSRMRFDILLLLSLTLRVAPLAGLSVA